MASNTDDIWVIPPTRSIDTVTITRAEYDALVAQAASAGEWEDVPDGEYGKIAIEHDRLYVTDTDSKGEYEAGVDIPDNWRIQRRPRSHATGGEGRGVR